MLELDDIPYIDSNEKLPNVKSISETKKQLDTTADKIQLQIRNSFERLREALYFREKQLLRQIEALIHSQKLALVQSNSENIPVIFKPSTNLSNEKELKQLILNFGQIDLSKYVATNDIEPYILEEYGEDHESYEKSLRLEDYSFNNTKDFKLPDYSILNRTLDISLNLLPEPYSLETESPNVTFENHDEASVSVSEYNEKNDDSSHSLKLSTESIASVNNQGTEIGSENTKFCCAENNEITENSPELPKNDVERSNLKNADQLSNEKGLKNISSYSVQIQQWLQEILEETETEPIIYEIGQFSKVPYTRLCGNLPLET